MKPSTQRYLIAVLILLGPLMGGYLTTQAQTLPSARLPRSQYDSRFMARLKATLDSMDTAKANSSVTIAYVVVATYELAKLQATGTKPKRIRVTSEGNTYDYWPGSTATDQLELIITN